MLLDNLLSLTASRGTYTCVDQTSLHREIVKSYNFTANHHKVIVHVRVNTALKLKGLGVFRGGMPLS